MGILGQGAHWACLFVPAHGKQDRPGPAPLALGSPPALLTTAPPPSALHAQAFLSLCQGNHYQFDTLRRAKHSSMMVLYHLHNPTAPAFSVTCNVCALEIEPGTGWRCSQCSDFDMCGRCYASGLAHHPHPLTVSRGAAPPGYRVALARGYEACRAAMGHLGCDGWHMPAHRPPGKSWRSRLKQRSVYCAPLPARLTLPACLCPCPRLPLQKHVRKIDEQHQRLTEKERQERNQQLQRTMALLVHASACNDPRCPSNNCAKVRRGRCYAAVVFCTRKTGTQPPMQKQHAGLLANARPLSMPCPLAPPCPRRSRLCSTTP